MVPAQRLLPTLFVTLSLLGACRRPGGSEATGEVAAASGVEVAPTPGGLIGRWVFVDSPIALQLGALYTLGGGDAELVRREAIARMTGPSYMDFRPDGTFCHHQVFVPTGMFRSPVAMGVGFDLCGPYAVRDGRTIDVHEAGRVVRYQIIRHEGDVLRLNWTNRHGIQDYTLERLPTEAQRAALTASLTGTWRLSDFEMNGRTLSTNPELRPRFEGWSWEIAADGGFLSRDGVTSSRGSWTLERTDRALILRTVDDAPAQPSRRGRRREAQPRETRQRAVLIGVSPTTLTVRRTLRGSPVTIVFTRAAPGRPGLTDADADAGTPVAGETYAGAAAEPSTPATSPPPSPEPSDPASRFAWPDGAARSWRGAWRHASSRFDLTLSLRRSGERLSGDFNWTLRAARGSLQARRGAQAREYVRGELTRGGREITLSGYRVSDPSLIVVDQYRLTITPTGELVGRSRTPSGDWSGRVTASPSR